VTVREAIDEFLAGARDGTILVRGGRRYKPVTIRNYESTAHNHVFPELGDVPLARLDTLKVQDFANRLLGSGLAPSSVSGKLSLLYAVCSRAVKRGALPANPVHGVELPAPRREEIRIVELPEVRQRLDLVHHRDRPVWATAFYTGLRCGELQALRWSDVDLDRNWLYVRADGGWDVKEGSATAEERQRDP
jgi:integrase